MVEPGLNSWLAHELWSDQPCRKGPSQKPKLFFRNCAVAYLDVEVELTMHFEYEKSLLVHAK